MAKVKNHSYLKWVIWCSSNFKAHMFVRFQMIAMAQFIVFLSIVRIKHSMTKKTFYFEARDRGAGGGGGSPPHFLPQTQFLTAFLGHRVTKFCKVTRTVTKI